MKGKKFTYLLIICVAGVWGIIFYRIYAGMSEEEEPVAIVEHGAKPEYFKLVNHETDQVELNLNYRDPFALAPPVIIETAKPVTPSEFRMPNNMPIQKPQVNWSAIKYTGYIFNPSTKQQVAIMQVNGAEAMLAEGQSLNGLQLIKYAGDSVKVKYQNITKYITIK